MKVSNADRTRSLFPPALTVQSTLHQLSARDRGMTQPDWKAHCKVVLTLIIVYLVWVSYSVQVVLVFITIPRFFA
jgi:hypothetical protein